MMTAITVLVNNPISLTHLLTHSLTHSLTAVFIFFLSTDVDECATESLNDCDQECALTVDGWYNCSCKDGYTLNQDGHTCDGACVYVRIHV